MTTVCVFVIVDESCGLHMAHIGADMRESECDEKTKKASRPHCGDFSDDDSEDQFIKTFPPRHGERGCHWSSGDVGQGVVAECVEAGFQVAAVGRDTARLTAALGTLASNPNVTVVQGSVSDESTAEPLLAEVKKVFPTGIDAVVTSVNQHRAPVRLVDQSAAYLREILDSSMVAHFVAAKTFIPALNANGVYISLCGGAADFVWPGYGQISSSNAGQRMLLQAVAHDFKDTSFHIYSLVLYSIITGASNRDQSPDPNWITAEEVGRHIVSMIRVPDEFKGVVQDLKSKETVKRL